MESNLQLAAASDRGMCYVHFEFWTFRPQAASFLFSLLNRVAHWVSTLYSDIRSRSHPLHDRRGAIWEPGEPA
jgi:hypothetical protein